MNALTVSEPHPIQKEAVHTALKSAKSAEEAMDIAGLNWTVEEVELVTTNGLPVPQRKALYRSDNKAVIGVVGNNYSTLQNHEAFAFADTLVEKFGATYEHAYSLNGGANILLQMKINGGFDVRPGDHVDKYLNLSNHHDGGGSVMAFSGTLRAWCANQFRLMLRGAQDCIRIQHKGTLQERFAEAIKVFNMSQDVFKLFQEKCQVLTQKQVDRQMVERFLDTVVGKPVEQVFNSETNTFDEIRHPKIEAKREKITELFESGKGNTGTDAWDIFNATTEFVDHFSNVGNDNRRYASALLGSGAQVKQLAFETAMAL